MVTSPDRSVQPTSSNQPDLSKKPEFRQEFRLGLVVYGGVSLAIYMNGVCREFYNAVRGRGIYKLIKALTDSDVIVDVISGTSAGGINGVLLSYALTNSSEEVAVDFKNFAEIWRESGDINLLLRQPAPNHEVNSVLDGEGYYQDRLAEAFCQAWAKRDQKPQQQEAEWFSDSSELDLFVTGTDTLGRVYKAFDNTGSIIEIKDHRSVFLLKYRRDRKHPFKPPQSSAAKQPEVPQSALAKLCRITSCFPVAFPVVTVQLNRPDLDQGLKNNLQISQSKNNEDYFTYAVDKHLVQWGQLNNRELPPPETTVAKQHQLYFVDGGVLDNRPFSYTIEEIYRRTAYRPVQRRLFYIDPSPDQFLGSAKFTKMAKPSIWETVGDSLVSMPRYESIANDLKEIKDRNKRVVRYKLLRSGAEEIGQQRLEQVRKLAQEPVKTDISPQKDSQNLESPEDVYLRCRLIAMRDRILPLVLKVGQVGGGRTQSHDQNREAILESAAQLITKYVVDQGARAEQKAFLNDLGQQIRNLDISYALRKHFFLLEKICQKMAEFQHHAPNQCPHLYQHLKNLSGGISRQVELLEVVQYAVEGMLRSEPVSQTFYTLLEQAKKAEAEAVENTAFSASRAMQKREDTRQVLYEFLLRLHRFMLDADGLVDFEPQPNLSDRDYSIDEPTGKLELIAIPANFFKALPSEPLDSNVISSVLQQLKQKAALLTAEALSQPSESDERSPNLNSKSSIWQDKYAYVANSENTTDQYFSLLRNIEQASERLIQNRGGDLADELLNSFQSFRYIDEEVYAYEYLSDIQAKEQIEIIRISPDVAQFGFGKGKGLEDKLAGDQLNAFGGFFKKSWRSNDILWGRLDGLNRIAEALLTPETLKNFSKFASRQAEEQNVTISAYIEALVNESLPEATPAEKDRTIGYLMHLANGNAFEKVDLTRFLDTIVTAGHRTILKTDLSNVLEDASAEQIKWGQQLTPSKKSFRQTLTSVSNVLEDARAKKNEQDQQLTPSKKSFRQTSAGVGSKSVKFKELPSLSEQELALQRVANIVACLLSPRGQRNLRLTDLDALKTAFTQSTEADLEKISQYPLRAAKSQTSIDELYEFLNRVLKAGRHEINQAGLNPQVKESLTQLNDSLKTALEYLKPKYEPVRGYFDRTITPFTAKELADIQITPLLSDSNRIDDYFRNVYRVGSETLAKDLPPIALEDLLARTGLVLRDIVGSPPSGRYVRKLTTFQLINLLLQGFYVWVQSKKTASFAPKSLQVWGSLLLLVGAIGSVAFLISKLPVWLLVLLITFFVLRAISKALKLDKSPAWVSWAATIGIVLLIVTGLRFLPDSNSTVKTPFGELNISIQNTAQ